MKNALLLNAINPRIGGVLIRGEKGTAKSTAVRALARLLPDIQVRPGCRFGCDPGLPGEWCGECRSSPDNKEAEYRPMRVIELPVSATEDKVVGSLDIGHAIKEGEKRFEPGILAGAHRNILYVDEINLLHDHIVDVLLDAAAMGVNIVEREGVSYNHPSSFILVGTMNPEEGELRPQLLDRFGLCVDIEGIRDPEIRLQVMQRRIAYEADPAGFASAWQKADRDIRDRVVRAKSLLPAVHVPVDLMRMIVSICIDMQVDGHRADLVMFKAAATLAAWNERDTVTEEDIRGVAGMVLSHRLRRTPFADQKMEPRQLEESIARSHLTPLHSHGDSGSETPPPCAQNRADPGAEHNLPEGSPFSLNTALLQDHRKIGERLRRGRGRRRTTRSDEGRYVRSRMPSARPHDIALDATLRAAAPHQLSRKTGHPRNAVQIEDTDIREKVRERRLGTTMIFVVDASGSMGAQARMTAVKGAVLSLLIDAYQKRDRVGLVVFRGSGAEVILPPTGSVELARQRMQNLAVGKKTPLAHGLMKGYEMLVREQEKDNSVIPRLVLVSDGRGNVPLSSSNPLMDAVAVAERIWETGIAALVIDTESGLVSIGAARRIARALDGVYCRLEDMKADGIAGTVRSFNG